MAFTYIYIPSGDGITHPWADQLCRSWRNATGQM